MWSTLIQTIFAILFIYVGMSVVYLFVLALWSRFAAKPKGAMTAEPQARIAILVPAYKEDGVILSTATSLLRLNYPSHLYDAYIIVDSFQPETIAELRKLPVQAFEVSFEKSTKTKSLNQAFSRISKEYDLALICDADNVLARNFLMKVNEAFVKGARAIQGRRVAKNLDTPFAILDACSEGINNNIFRKGANAMGLSSSVIGSGMAIDFNVLKATMKDINSVAEDKIIQLSLVEQGIKIQYVEDALIFDEKVDSPHAFRQQRKRWVSSQFIYLKKFFLPAMRQLLKGNVSYFNLAIANNLVLPRAFLFLILPLVVIFSFFVGGSWIAASFIMWAVFLAGMVLALPKELINRDLGNAIMRLPRAIGIMFGTVLQIRKSNKTFIHTVHTKTEINNPLFNEHK